jgi:3-hydroxyisobutyrate dehydrogenase-like beta-hydroxyacid dehydrogenase
VQGLSEGIHFGKRAGLDVEAVLDVISKGAAQSWQMENRGKTMNDGKFDFGFAVDWMRKDLSICLAEGLHFAKKSGLDIEKLIATISKGAAQSWQMENRYKTMAAGKFDFGFAVDWMRKDLGICMSEARRNGAHLPVTALVDQFYSQVQKMGGKRWDTSSLIALLDR